MRTLAWLAIALLAPSAYAQSTAFLPEPNEAPACDLPEPVLFADADVAFENLAFDGLGNLWLTAFADGLYRAYPNGTVEHVMRDEERAGMAVGLDDPSAFMGIDVGPDGALYVSEGLSIATPVAARVLRFPMPGAPEFEVYAEGMDGANGLAVTPDGAVFVVHGFREEVWRIPSPGQLEVWTELPTANGLVEHPDGERLVFAAVVEPTTTMIAVPLDDPEGREALVSFNAPGGPLHAKGIDDLVVADDGMVYASAHLRDQVLRGDPSTGDVCVAIDMKGLAGSGPEDNVPASVRIARGFGEWSGLLFSVDFAGEIWALDIGLPAEVAVSQDAAPREAALGGWTILAAGLGVALVRRPRG